MLREQRQREPPHRAFRRRRHRKGRQAPAIVSEDGSNLESRSNISYAANILCGFTQSLVCTTSHHIIAQALGGFFPNVPHGASLLLIADAYYKKVCSLLPTEFDAIGEIMGEKADPAKPGYAS